jgi:hypothetical protein
MGPATEFCMYRRCAIMISSGSSGPAQSDWSIRCGEESQVGPDGSPWLPSACDSGYVQLLIDAFWQPLRRLGLPPRCPCRKLLMV